MLVALVTLRAPWCIFIPSSCGLLLPRALCGACGVRRIPQFLSSFSTSASSVPVCPPGRALSPCSCPSCERLLWLVWGDGGSQFFWSFVLGRVSCLAPVFLVMPDRGHGKELVCEYGPPPLVSAASSYSRLLYLGHT